MNRSMCFYKFLITALLLCAWSIIPADLRAAEMAQRLFALPEDAVKSLQEAIKSKDKEALMEVLGPQVKDLLTGDQQQDAKNAQKFDELIKQGYLLVKEQEDKIILEVGPNHWPMPIPLVRLNGQWLFDTAAGKEEIINRHIGKDELHAIGVCRAYVAAQRQYAIANMEAGGRARYARALGSLFAQVKTQPFHGYFFKILTRQGQAAPGGKMNYMSHGNLTNGFALVAYPVNWGHSGIMTFIVNQEAHVFQRDLGETTSRVGRTMKEYDPDSEWAMVEDQGIVNATIEK